MPLSSRSNYLALLIAAPQSGEIAMLRDQAAMVDGLLARGLLADQILCLHGRLDRSLVTAFLHAASRRVAPWTGGSVFLHVSGHGFIQGESAENARPGLLFTENEDYADDGHLLWEDFFAAQPLPVGVDLTLLPDL
ncbi:MAG: hypothetical protein BWY10_02579 [Chloroflexi bacterium ADurb.Bin180]|nr:MAG: hypothetical protein BWY10_02579 [Chloroflexi bacterium ADurb.Bin180]